MYTTRICLYKKVLINYCVYPVEKTCKSAYSSNLLTLTNFKHELTWSYYNSVIFQSGTKRNNGGFQK